MRVRLYVYLHIIFSHKVPTIEYLKTEIKTQARVRVNMNEFYCTSFSFSQEVSTNRCLKTKMNVDIKI